MKILGAELGSWDHSRKLTPDNYEMLVIAGKR